MSINDRPEVREMFDGFEQIEIETTYTIGAGAAQTAPELLFTNRNRESSLPLFCDNEERS